MFFLDYFREKKRVLDYKIASKNAFEIENVSFVSNKRKVVDNFNFKFEKKKVYAIIGAAGSGKSTVAAHFNGLMKSPKGNVFLFNGENIYFFRKKIPNFLAIRRTIGMVLQNPEYQLFKETVLEDVCCGLKMLKLETENSEDKAKEKLKELGIGEEFFTRNPFMLSGGQKKKVALSGILVIDPEIIVFDEPVLGLDPVSIEKIVEIIKELKRKEKTIIVISNNIDLIFELAEEVLVMDRGRLVMSGNPYTIFRDTRLSLGTPKIIQFINKLTQKSSKFEVLWDLQPKDYSELADSIVNVLRK